MLYNSVTINISNPQSQLNHTAHFDDLKKKKWWFEIGDLVGDFTKKLVTRMDGAPKQPHEDKELNVVVVKYMYE